MHEQEKQEELCIEIQKSIIVNLFAFSKKKFCVTVLPSFSIQIKIYDMATGIKFPSTWCAPGYKSIGYT
jgi:hypothetical protein